MPGTGDSAQGVDAAPSGPAASGDGGRGGLGPVLIGAALIALGVFVFTQLGTITADGGYSVLGPRFSPMLIGVGLLVVGVILVGQALTSGWKGIPALTGKQAFHAPGFAWIAGAMALHVVVIGFIGFTLACMLLFAAVARGFGSRRTLRNLVVGFVLAASIFLFFTHVLGLGLPAGPLRVV